MRKSLCVAMALSMVSLPLVSPASATVPTPAVKVFCFFGARSVAVATVQNKTATFTFDHVAPPPPIHKVHTQATMGGIGNMFAGLASGNWMLVVSIAGMGSSQSTGFTIPSLPPCPKVHIP